jgi:hypothetical protein
MAEIALELFGAKAAHEFVREAWALATPEAKQAIADALAAAVAKRIGESDWELRNVVQGAAAEVAEAWVEEHHAEIEARVRAAMERNRAALEQYLERWARDAAQRALEESLRRAFAERPPGLR